MPSQFKISSFPFKKNIEFEKKLDSKELGHLAELLKENDVTTDILLSDYDQDGIRDFTVSEGHGKVIISAEDRDWDNDGINNLIDETVGKVKVGSVAKNQHIQNNFILRNVDAKEVERKLKSRGITLINERSSSHDLLVLNMLENIFSMLPNEKFRVDVISATTPKVSYGSKVFFSYIAQSRTIEFYPTKFYKFLLKERQKRFSSSTDSVFVNKYVSLVILHSLSHELAHSVEVSEKDFKEFKLSWEEKEIGSTYLKKFRNPVKIMSVSKNKYKLGETSFLEIQKEYSAYQKDLKKFYKDNSGLNLARKVKWYTGIDEDKEYWFSFSTFFNIPSLYAMTNSKEWFAENYAACFFQKVKAKIDKKESIRLEKLIGLNPLGVPKGFVVSILKYRFVDFP